MCGFWEQGKLLWSMEMDSNGYSSNLKFDGRSIASIRVVDGLEVINMNIRNMKIGNNACNSKEIQRFVLSNAPCIETISIGSNCCKNVTFFQIEDLPSLRKVTILEDSFTTFNRTTYLSNQSMSAACNVLLWLRILLLIPTVFTYKYLLYSSVLN